jgi:hypothetical protein
VSQQPGRGATSRPAAAWRSRPPAGMRISACRTASSHPQARRPRRKPPLRRSGGSDVPCDKSRDTCPGTEGALLGCVRDGWGLSGLMLSAAHACGPSRPNPCLGRPVPHSMHPRNPPPARAATTPWTTSWCVHGLGLPRGAARVAAPAPASSRAEAARPNAQPSAHCWTFATSPGKNSAIS